jgi:hypothetical protein
MGLVHVRGKTTGDDRLTSPLTGVPCFYYRVQLEKWVKKENENGQWEKVGTETAERKFYLADGTAQVLVDPHNAQYEVVRTFSGEVGLNAGYTRTVRAGLGVAGPSEQELQAYVQGRLTRVRAAVEATNAPGAKAAGKVLGVAQKMEALGLSMSGDGLTIGTRLEQRYRLTEHCLLADRECNILGTCAENPNPRDDNDRNLIRKGENEKTFLITSESEKQIEKSLRRRAVIMILLGAVVMIGATAIGLHIAGML